MARGLCFKPRPAIGKYPDGPMQPGEKYALNVDVDDYEPTYDAAYLSKVDYDLWLGPAPKRPFNRNRFHYNWHWHWDYGNGDSGNQGPHQFDIARWGLQKQEHPVKVSSVGGYFGAESSQETPNMQTASSSTPTARSSSSARAASSRTTKAACGSATCSTAPRAGCGSRRAARSGSRTGRGRRTRKGPGADAADRAEPTGLTTTEYPALSELRRRDPRRRSEDADVRRLEGHLSSALPHLGNISYRVGHVSSCSTASRKSSSTTRRRTSC